MPNPLVKAAVTGAGIAAGVIGSKLLAGGWGAVFGEEAPTPKVLRSSAKQTKLARKQAKKDGLSRSEIAAIRDPRQDQPIWKGLLWVVLSGAALTAFRQLAQKGAERGAERLTARRPRPNRG
ncbi:DUF4235 domain-containing protein [Brachybacterium hainanense]|uniref:DUF4235 domain-containing protein n=1 Tax=Brachybacterium hainanense TaxID=1541174 RepID=A0ABV6RJH0_9MICO